MCLPAAPVSFCRFETIFINVILKLLVRAAHWTRLTPTVTVAIHILVMPELICARSGADAIRLVTAEPASVLLTEHRDTIVGSTF